MSISFQFSQITSHNMAR